jgi:hypothetical protein
VNEILQQLSKYATPEVITVFGALLVAGLGWKAAQKSAGLLGSVAQKAGFLGVTAAILFMTGVGSTGLGVGELVCRVTNSPSNPKDKGINDEKLLQLAEKCHDKDMAKLLMDYARVRDGDTGNEDVRVLTSLIERQMTNCSTEKDREANAKSLNTFIEYLSARERNKNGTATAVLNKESLVSLTTTVPGEPTIQPKEHPSLFAKLTNNDSLLSIPWAVGLIGLGIGGIFCGVVCHRVNKKGTVSA